MEIRADNLRVVVTAGASGLGRVVAETFLDAGARVHAADVDAIALDRLARGRASLSTSCTDVGDSAAVDRMFDQATAELGGLDVLVNNAGIAGPTGRADTLSPEDWDRTMAVNANGPFYCVRRAIPLLEAAAGGSIVNIASTAGLMGYPLRTPYAASKWAVVGLTKSLAMELGEIGIRVNAICPGALKGDRMDRIFAAEASAKSTTVDEIQSAYVSQVSMRTMIDPQEIADMVLFLCSEQGRHITGQAFSIDGHTETLR